MTRNERKRRVRLALTCTAMLAATAIILTILCDGMDTPISAEADFHIERPSDAAAIDIAAAGDESEYIAPILHSGESLNCRITYYCCEKYDHICGTGDGITASGKEIEEGMCAADDIPLGATVMVDYDYDGNVDDYFVCEDRFGDGQTNHIDVAVATHDEAVALGAIEAAHVYWVIEVEED